MDHIPSLNSRLLKPPLGFFQMALHVLWPYMADMQAEIFAEIFAESKLADLDFSRFY